MTKLGSMEETGKQYVVVKYISGSMKVQSRHKRASTDTKVPTYPNNAGSAILLELSKIPFLATL